eukprot:354628-Pelagomonas_calceolata.AAC.1
MTHPSCKRRQCHLATAPPTCVHQLGAEAPPAWWLSQSHPAPRLQSMHAAQACPGLRWRP